MVDGFRFNLGNWNKKGKYFWAHYFGWFVCVCVCVLPMCIFRCIKYMPLVVIIKFYLLIISCYLPFLWMFFFFHSFNFLAPLSSSPVSFLHNWRVVYIHVNPSDLYTNTYTCHKQYIKRQKFLIMLSPTFK